MCTLWGLPGIILYCIVRFVHSISYAQQQSYEVVGSTINTTVGVDDLDRDQSVWHDSDRVDLQTAVRILCLSFVGRT